MPGSGRDAWLADGEGCRSGGPGEFARLVGIEADAERAEGRRLPSQDGVSLSVRAEHSCRGTNDILHDDMKVLQPLIITIAAGRGEQGKWH